MLQRIQSVYILAATLLYFFMINNPLAVIMLSDDQVLEMDVIKVYSTTDQNFESISVWPVSSLLIVIMFAGLISLFLYKKRTIQMRICMYNIFLMIGLAVLIWIYTGLTAGSLEAEMKLIKWPLVIPLISAILTYLAIRAIRKDDALIKSYERIR